MSQSDDEVLKELVLEETYSGRQLIVFGNENSETEILPKEGQEISDNEDIYFKIVDIKYEPIHITPEMFSGQMPSTLKSNKKTVYYVELVKI